jgi:hypothetical protein
VDAIASGLQHNSCRMQVLRLEVVVEGIREENYVGGFD